MLFCGDGLLAPNLRGKLPMSTFHTEHFGTITALCACHYRALRVDITRFAHPFFFFQKTQDSCTNKSLDISILLKLNTTKPLVIPKYSPSIM